MHEHISRKMLKKVLLTNKVIYTISPSLFSRPDYWRENLQVVGFHKCSSNLAWNPNHDLVDFLKIHKDERILYITFGSMTNPIPDEKTEILISILEQNQIPVIIGTASGGLVEPAGFRSDNIHFEAEIPYEWIFPKVYGVIHHGGSGTTHLGL